MQNPLKVGGRGHIRRLLSNLAKDYSDQTSRGTVGSEKVGGCWKNIRVSISRLAMYLTLGEGVEKRVWVPSSFWLEELNGGNAFQGSKGTGGGV